MESDNARACAIGPATNTYGEHRVTQDSLGSSIHPYKIPGQTLIDKRMLPHDTTCPRPLVSVAITAFNSERWLAQALDSALRQKAEFQIEIVIADDNSTDQTIAIAKSYAEAHPHIVRVLERNPRLGMNRNFYQTFEQCRGVYIAWLDSDDIWTDPKKLALQIAVLESDPGVSVCAHYVRWIAQDGEVVRNRYPALPPGRYGLKEIIRHDFVPSASIVFRNGIHRKLSESYFHMSDISDWPLLIVAALSGDIVLLDRVMADYRLTPGSAMTSKGHLHWHTMDVNCYEFMETVLPPEWFRCVRAQKGKRYESIAYFLRREGQFAASRRAAIKAFTSPDWMDNFSSKTRSLIAALVREMESQLLRKN